MYVAGRCIYRMWLRWAPRFPQDLMEVTMSLSLLEMWFLLLVFLEPMVYAAYVLITGSTGGGE